MNASESQHDHNKTRRTQLIQTQLVLLLHARKCLKRDKEVNTNTCTLPYCSTMKGVVEHMGKCNDDKTCTFPRCIISRRTLLHWEHCHSPQCRICVPLKEKVSSAKSNHKKDNLEETLKPMKSIINKEWQKSFPEEMRHDIILKFISVLIPLPKPSEFHNQRFINLIDYVRKVEKNIFDMAENHDEYIEKLADKIYHIELALENRAQE